MKILVAVAAKDGSPWPPGAKIGRTCSAGTYSTFERRFRRPEWVMRPEGKRVQVKPLNTGEAIGPRQTSETGRLAKRCTEALSLSRSLPAPYWQGRQAEGGSYGG